MAQSFNNPWETDPIKFSSQISEICFQKYQTIGKQGKPLPIQNKLEWTILAGIVACFWDDAREKYYLECVSLGKIGDIIHDSHAEILTRRGFIKLKLAIRSESKYFCMKNEHSPFILKNSSTSFHMYISQAPFVKIKDGFRKGRIDYNSYGVLRTKPAQWNVVGLQSALLSELISPIYLSSIIVGDMFSQKDLNRAFYERIQSLTNLPNGYLLNKPTIIPSTMKFERSKSFLAESFPGKNLISLNIATVWIKDWISAEILISGRKQGATKSKNTGLYSTKTRSSFTKLNLFQSIELLLNKIPNNNIPSKLRPFIESPHKTYTYYKFKQLCENYQIAKQTLRFQHFCQWIKCPYEIYESFNVNGELISG
ncbi:9723_t:CDS:10 [Diversispora eburnea]|uniref:9723_t:CDS:1 n=1 Tax=Diversispora eburnea TaxID=1213867 RepID=A0A9N8V8Q1_9GLOM|nr:9723_t:CDS:10 [Diversispora eburnea]